MFRRHRSISRALALTLVLTPASLFLPGLASPASADVICVGAGVPIIGTGVSVCI